MLFSKRRKTKFWIFILGARFKQNADDVGDFRLERKSEYELHLDLIHPFTALTLVGKYIWKKNVL